MYPYAFSQCPEDPASGPDTQLVGQPSFIFPSFPAHHPPHSIGIRTELMNLILMAVSTSDRLRNLYIPLAIHNITQVGVLVGGVDFLALQGHISGQLPAYSHYLALGGIHSHFPSVRPFGYGIQRGLQIG
ncbi:hypothetical protein AYI69_g9702 [Smittium culicis]|uniref:Uncharacterized protein n=1 Tax=Smittium culicis TaxID=133412 RepID=A0A1R1XB01_9FUNG|nr:hypothetical protein AYI69_g9702 [Smittium culicis]